MTLSPSDTTLAIPCAKAPPSLLLRGIAEFNTGRYYACHETLEELWRAERGEARNLYQGILQLGVGCYHAARGNSSGAFAQLRKGLVRLRALPPVCQTVNVVLLCLDGEAYFTALAAGRDNACPPKVMLAP